MVVYRVLPVLLNINHFLGTKGAGAIIKLIKSRDVRLKANVDKYNELAKDLTSQGYRIPPLPLDSVSEILASDAFWELERMHTRESWALNPRIRTGIDVILRVKRAREEINLLQEAFGRFVHYHTSRLGLISSNISNYQEGTLLRIQLQKEAGKSIASIVNLQKHFRTLWNIQKQRPKTWKQQAQWIEKHVATMTLLEGTNH